MMRRKPQMYLGTFLIDMSFPNSQRSHCEGDLMCDCATLLLSSTMGN